VDGADAPTMYQQLEQARADVVACAGQVELYEGKLEDAQNELADRALDLVRLEFGGVS
jgi:hypothetical protein